MNLILNHTNPRGSAVRLKTCPEIQIHSRSCYTPKASPRDLDNSRSRRSFTPDRAGPCKRVVLPHMNAYPGVNSVLLLDNCTIHNADEITHAVHAIGARIEYLEPYELRPRAHAYRIRLPLTSEAEAPVRSRPVSCMRTCLPARPRAVAYSGSL